MQGAPDRCSTHLLLLSARASPRTKSKWTLDRRSTHLLLLSVRASPCTKSKGVSDRRSTHLLLLSARASPRTKSKGLHSYYQYTRSSSSMQKKKVTKPWSCRYHRTRQDYQNHMKIQSLEQHQMRWRLRSRAPLHSQ
jgi:hypothetical protein